MKENKNVKVIYLTCLENTMKNDIHQSQVLGLSNKGIDYTFLFISPLFILGKAGFQMNRNKSSQKDVREVKIPIFSANLVMHLFLIPYYFLIACPILLYYVNKENASIVHCRNLVTSLLAVFSKVFLFQKFKVICDPRSVYVEEGVIIGRFKYNGFNYKGWKKLERWIYRKSDCCLGLSENFADYLRLSNNDSIFIPAIVRPTFVYNERRRQELRERLGLTELQRVCIYVGSIGQWHSVEALLKILDSYKESMVIGEELKVVFLSGNKNACVEISNHYNDDELIKCGRVSPEDVLDYLQIADFGIVPGTDKEGYCYDLLYETMLSSKAEEFMAAGLPIIVNKRIVSLAKMLNEQQYCLIFDGNKVENKPIVKNRKEMSVYYNSMFNANTVVGEYRELYKRLLTKGKQNKSK